MQVRKWVSQVEEICHEGGAPPKQPLRKVLVGAVFKNPYAETAWSEELALLVAPSAALARELVHRGLALLGGPAESCGKAALIGLLGEQEHGVACMTSSFGDALRSEISGAAWVVSNTKVASAGSSIDVPLAYKSALMVRDFYDTATLIVTDSPKPDEILIVIGMADGPRIHHRMGGLKKSEANRGDGLR